MWKYLSRILPLMLTFPPIGASDAPDPITDRMRYEIAAAERDYLSAKIQLDLAAAQMKAKLDAGNKACAAVDKTFNADSLACIDKPAERKP